MPAGQVAIICSLCGALGVALIAAIANHRGSIIKRGSDMVSIYMARLKDTEAENDKLTDKVQQLREQHIVDMTALEKVTRLEAEVTELKRLLKVQTERTGEQ